LRLCNFSLRELPSAAVDLAWPPRYRYRSGALRLGEDNSIPDAINYAGFGRAPTRESAYGIASICVSVCSVAWFFGPLVFDAAKQDRIGMLGGLTGAILGIAGWRQTQRKHTLAGLGFWVGLAAFGLNFLFPTL
jgi:hypothetical protein